MTSTPPAAAADITAELSAEELRLIEWIEGQAKERGNAVINVASDDEGAGYSFTACAWALHNVPEAVVVGLPGNMGQVLLDAYVDRAANGEIFEVGKRYDNFFDGVPVVLERVDKGHYPEYFGTAFLIYPDGDFPALQLIVATPEGKFPWHPDAPAGFAGWQRVLTGSGRPESWTPGVDGP